MGTVCRRFAAGIGLLTVLLLMGCTIRQELALPPVGLPEAIQVGPPAGPDARTQRAAVYRLAEPGHSPGVGATAAEEVYRALLAAGVYATLSLRGEPRCLSLAETVADARRAGFDVALTGDVNDYFDGSDFMPARVTATVRAVDVTRDPPQLRWQVVTAETVAPVAAAHYIVVDTAGVPAPAPRLLMRRNARKVVNLLAGWHAAAVSGAPPLSDRAARTVPPQTRAAAPEPEPGTATSYSAPAAAIPLVTAWPPPLDELDLPALAEQAAVPAAPSETRAAGDPASIR